MSVFVEGNQYGRRNDTPERYLLYRKQKNLFTCIDNRFKRVNKKTKVNLSEKYPGISIGRKMHRMLKVLILNMDADGWCRNYITVAKYYDKQSGPARKHARSCNTYRYNQSNMRERMINCGLATQVEVLPSLLGHATRRQGVKINPELLYDLQIPEKYLYTGSTYMYDNGILDTHLQYNQHVKNINASKQAIK